MARTQNGCLSGTIRTAKFGLINSIIIILLMTGIVVVLNRVPDSEPMSVSEMGVVLIVVLFFVASVNGLLYLFCKRRKGK